MGKAQIRISWELLAQFLHFPEDWKPDSAFMQIHRYATTEPHATLFLIVESESIEEQIHPVEMEGTFKAKYMEESGERWMNGEWKVSPYQTNKSE